MSDCSNYTALTGASGTVSIVTMPGDCNGDGVVQVNEVQSAINMYLHLKTPASCVDLDNNGLVMVNEVQKVINAYLKLF